MIFLFTFKTWLTAASVKPSPNTPSEALLHLLCSPCSQAILHQHLYGPDLSLSGNVSTAPYRE